MTERTSCIAAHFSLDALPAPALQQADESNQTLYLMLLFGVFQLLILPSVFHIRHILLHVIQMSFACAHCPQGCVNLYGQ